MTKSPLRLLLLLAALIVQLSIGVSAIAEMYHDPMSGDGLHEDMYGTQETYDTQSSLQTLFSNIETVGNAYNSGGEAEAGKALLDSGCQALVSSIMTSSLFGEMPKNFLGVDNLPEQASSFLTGKAEQMKLSALNAGCAALKGEQVGTNIDLANMARQEMLPMLLMAGQNAAHGTGLPFLTRLEIESGIEDGDYFGSITSVQPLWEDPTDTHHVFAQVSWYKTNDEKYADTVNAGIAYRHLNKEKDTLLGANLFFDHAYERNHNRMSLGVDARTSLLGVSANRYMPLSTWRAIDFLTEERATAGWDLEVRGQVPSLPSWTGTVKGYTWDGHGGEDDTYGYQTNVEYSPVPALAVRAGVRDESTDDPSLELALRFNWRFDQPTEMQMRPRLELAPVTDFVYEKVHRENRIRVSQRLRDNAYLTVINTTGANTFAQTALSGAITLNQTLTIPVTVTVANTVGAVVRLQFADGAVLTIGQNSQVRIEAGLITLINGTMQFVSGSTNQIVNVPGGTIVLLGTDIDVVSNGTDSSVRVRDGSVRLTGTVAGTITIGAGSMGESVAGTVGTVANGSPDYVAHADQVSTRIDRVAPPLDVAKSAPYPDQAPTIVQDNFLVGDTVQIGLRFSKPINITGGTPRLTMTINGAPRTANLSAGNGTENLVFDYVLQIADIGTANIIVTGFDQNGSTITGTDGKLAVTTIADSTLTLSAPIGPSDVTAPAGYAVAFVTDPIGPGNLTAVAFDITSAEVGSTYNYTISSSGGGTNVTGSGTAGAATVNVTGVDVTGLNDGTLTVSVTMTDPSANVGGAVTDTAIKDIAAPSITSVTPPANATYGP